MTILSPYRVRAARALLGWSMGDLAKAARVSIATVKRYEDGRGAPASVGLLQDALETEGVQFLADEGQGAGVRCRAR